MKKPTIVCLCGSTRFSQAFREANLDETLAGRIVLTIGCDMKCDSSLGLGPEVKEMLDELHLRKIDLADEVFILNIEGYIGQSTMRELAYAIANGKKIRFLEVALGEQYMVDHSHELGAIAAKLLSEGHFHA
jgi:hypothetical protein